jgi:hypothetical protein
MATTWPRPPPTGTHRPRGRPSRPRSAGDPTPSLTRSNTDPPGTLCSPVRVTPAPSEVASVSHVRRETTGTDESQSSRDQRRRLLHSQVRAGASTRAISALAPRPKEASGRRSGRHLLLARNGAARASRLAPRARCPGASDGMHVSLPVRRRTGSGWRVRTHTRGGHCPGACEVRSSRGTTETRSWRVPVRWSVACQCWVGSCWRSGAVRAIV